MGLPETPRRPRSDGRSSRSFHSASNDRSALAASGGGAEETREDAAEEVADDAGQGADDEDLDARPHWVGLSPARLDDADPEQDRAGGEHRYVDCDPDRQEQ